MTVIGDCAVEPSRSSHSKPDDSPLASMDPIRMFSDITKWLEYDVLVKDFGGMLVPSSLIPASSAWESAAFGSVAALSSQLYAALPITDQRTNGKKFGNAIPRRGYRYMRPSAHPPRRCLVFMNYLEARYVK